ncbi:MAG: DUF2079 domain-containing protein [Flaviflexus sp.]|nr:DUF2079 domain-containing protein [Flaviflexus sp.]
MIANRESPTTGPARGRDNRRRTLRRPATSSMIALACALLALAVHGAMSVAMWRHHVVPSWDLGIFSQLARAYSDLSIPLVDIKAADFNLLGDHFHPLLILLGPLWLIAPSGLTLLLTQSALFALATYPLTRLAARRLGAVIGTVLGLSFALSWGLIEASWSQFHEIAFAVPLLSWGLTWWLEDRRGRAVIALSLLPFIKEDLGLTLAVLAIALLAREWLAGKASTRLAATTCALAAWGVVWFILAVKVILPALNPHGTWDYTENISLAEQLTQGWEAKSFTLVLLLLACGIIGLRSPIMVAVAPTLAWRFLGNVDYYWGPTMHYSAVLIPICLAALIDAAGTILGTEPATGIEAEPEQEDTADVEAGRDSQLTGAELEHTGATSKLTGVGNEAAGGAARRSLIRVAAGAALAGSLIMLPAGHISIIARAPAYDSHPEAVIEAAAEHETVAADVVLLAYLVPHTRVFWYGTTRPGDVEAVAVKAETADGDAAHWAGTRWGGQWRIEFDDGKWQLAVRYR